METAAKDAGAILLKYYKSHYDIRDKGYHNPVTTADYASDRFLKETLMDAYPDYGWLSEETADSPERHNKDRVWVVDPLDGTKEFIEGIPHFVVSIALVENSQPILGVLYNPITEELFAAEKGEGATLNGKSITCSKEINLANCVVLKSRSETRKGLWDPYKDKFKEFRSIGSVAYKLGLMSANKADLFVALRTKYEWDICAAHCIILESRAILLDLNGNDIRYNRENVVISPGIIAGNPILVRNSLHLFN